MGGNRLPNGNFPVGADKKPTGTDIFDDVSKGSFQDSILNDDIRRFPRILTFFRFQLHFQFTLSINAQEASN
jgi:hypothetical protein